MDRRGDGSQSLFHPTTLIAEHLQNGPTIIAGGSGVRVRNREGRELIDCGAGLWCVNIGYGRAGSSFASVALSEMRLDAQ